MDRIRIRWFGFAWGVTGTILYGGCMITMSLLGREGSVQFFNSLLHGIDTSSVIRMDVPIWEAGLGLVQTFLISWLVGACIAGIYNAAAGKP